MLSRAETPCRVVLCCAAGFLTPSELLSLQHVADTVAALQPLSDASDIFKLLPESSRWAGGGITAGGSSACPSLQLALSIAPCCRWSAARCAA